MPDEDDADSVLRRRWSMHRTQPRHGPEDT